MLPNREASREGSGIEQGPTHCFRTSVACIHDFAAHFALIGLRTLRCCLPVLGQELLVDTAVNGTRHRHVEVFNETFDDGVAVVRAATLQSLRVGARQVFKRHRTAVAVF